MGGRGRLQGPVLRRPNRWVPSYRGGVTAGKARRGIVASGSRNGRRAYLIGTARNDVVRLRVVMF